MPENNFPNAIHLSDPERQVLWPLAEGATYAEVGKTLGISPRTAESHVRNVRDKIRDATGGQAPVKAQKVARRALELEPASDWGISSTQEKTVEEKASTFGVLLRSLRRRKGIQGQDLARSLGVSPSTVSQWERSKRQPQDRASVIQLLEVLDPPEQERARFLALAGYSPAADLHDADGLEPLIKTLQRQVERAAQASSQLTAELASVAALTEKLPRATAHHTQVPAGTVLPCPPRNGHTAWPRGRRELRIAILEDEEGTAKRLKKLVEQGAASLEIDLEIERYASLPEALAGILDFKPDIITQDLGNVWTAISTSFNDESAGLASIRVLRDLFRQHRLDTKIVVIDRLDEPRVVGEAISLGVQGYLHKGDLWQEEPEALAALLLLIHNGNFVLSPRAEASYRRWLQFDVSASDMATAEAIVDAADQIVRSRGHSTVTARLLPRPGAKEVGAPSLEDCGDLLQGDLPLPETPEILPGAERIVATAVRLIREALRRPVSNPSTLLLAFLGDGLFDRKPCLDRHWRAAIQAALEQGWDVVQLARQASSRNQARSLAAGVLERLGARGRYSLLLLPEDHPPMPLSTLVLIPRLGGLQVLPTITESAKTSGQKEESDAIGFYYPPGPELDALYRHFAFLRQQILSLPPKHYAHMSMDFSDAVALAAMQDGDWMLVLDGLSERTVPPEVDKKRAETIPDADDRKLTLVPRILENRRRRNQAFQQQVQRFRFRELCPMRAIDRLVQKGDFAGDDWLTALGAEPESPDQRREHLRTVIKALEDYPNYELGLLDDDAADRYCNTFWAVKGSYAVLLETWKRNEQGGLEEVDFSIDDEQIVGLFRKYFDTIWQDLPSTQREKANVIAWLHEQLSQISD